MLFAYLILLLAPFSTVGLNLLFPRQTCGEAYNLCSPTGTVNASLPPVGPQLSSLFPDLVQAVSLEGSADFGSSSANVLDERQVATAFCCAQTSQCLLLPSFSIAFCWDRFTTDYYFPDGSYGSVVAGNYTSASGIQVNLIYGNWTSPDGATGNIYSSGSSMMPDTSTMPMPTPWTSTGVGSAIPASVLGSSTPVTMTMQETQSTTITAITLPSTTITVGTSECTHCNITIIPGLTGLPPTSTTGTVFPNTTNITSTGTGGTGIPSASSSIYGMTSIIPPFNSRGILTSTVSGGALTIFFLDILICAILI